MIYQIPDSKLTKLEKQCKRISNKGALIIFNIGEPCEIHAVNNDKVVIPGHEVEVEGSYVINGWEFVATIDHTPLGNIIRCINSDLEKDIPERYKDCGPECEHCHRIRSRKDTYLVHNLETNEWKQVGKTCLKEYTGGLDSEVCAAAAAFFTVCEEADYFEDDGVYGFNSNKYISSDEFKKYAYPLVKQNGYKKDVTVDVTLDAMFGRGVYYNEQTPEVAADEEIEEVNKYAESVSDDQYGYFRNAKLAWAKKFVEYRDLALLASFIGTYFKNKAELAKQETNSRATKYVGNVGDKIQIEVKSIRVLYRKSNSMFSYYAEPSSVYEIIDNDGNTFICYSTKDLLNAKLLKATIKGYNDYRGIKQTIITRAKVLETADNSGISANEALDTLLEYIDD